MPLPTKLPYAKNHRCDSFMPPGWFLCLTRCVFSIFHPHQSALSSFMHLLLIVNASTNFLIYCFMGNKFKTVLLAMVRELVKGKEQVGRHRKMLSFGTKTFCLGNFTTKKTSAGGNQHCHPGRPSLWGQERHLKGTPSPSSFSEV